MAPSDKKDIELDLFIPFGLKERYQILMFMLKDTNENMYIGETFTAYIKILEQSSDLSASSDEIQ
jgi:hypothetical protein